MRRRSWIARGGAALFSLALGAARAAAIEVAPAAVLLDRPEALEQLVVTALEADRISRDLTREATYAVADPAIASVNASGQVTPREEGTTEIVIRHDAEVARVPVEVRSLGAPVPISFSQEIIPILTKSGCNAGGCHGKAEGQNGFKLSVFGFDPAADYDAIVKQGRGRRLSPASPEHSLFLLKATAQVPHGGGRKIDLQSPACRRLLRWITEGSLPERAADAGIRSLAVEPVQVRLRPGSQQQLRVVAIDADGRRHSVTAEAEYVSNAATVAEATRDGLVVATEQPGEAAILVRYLGQVTVCRVTLPRPGVEFERPAEANFIDRLVWDKLESLGIAPSGAADDAMFLRRVYLDTIGTLPTADEARAFLADADPQKRAQRVDALLDRKEYADYWTMRWADLLRVDAEKLTPRGAVAMTRWLRRQIADNRPYDQLARDIVLARGNSFAETPAALYTVLDSPETLSRSFSQLFLGVRIECAQCHHHPSEKWSTDDYYALAGFFTGLERKGLPGGASAIVVRAGEDLKHPRTGQQVATRALDGPALDFAAVADRREVLADWMTSADNPFFARAIANRLWAHYFGRGLVEPVDDMRATNPATNEPLLAALAGHLVELRYDLKAFTRTLLASRVYQASSHTGPSNAGDEQNFSHAPYKALPAEVLLDAINLVTGAGEKFEGWPADYRAIEVWDNRLPNYFFRVFGRPVRATVCECERSNEPSIAQALHLMNSPEISEKLRSPSGRVRRLADAGQAENAIIDELYLAALARYPQEHERAAMLEAFAQAAGDRRAAAEDILWALLNSKEFIYNH